MKIFTRAPLALALGMLAALVAGDESKPFSSAKPVPQGIQVARWRTRAPWCVPVAPDNRIVLCEACEACCRVNGAPTPAVDCASGVCDAMHSWNAMGYVPEFQEYNQGEYVGRARTEHVQNYRLRVDDQLEFIFRVTRDEQPRPYQLQVGDQVRIESFIDKNLDRTLIIQPDGTITLPLLGQVRATHHTVVELQLELEHLYRKYYLDLKTPVITVTPIQVNTKLEDLRFTVAGRSGSGAQVRSGRVTPDGTIALPAVGNVPAQGLTLEELKNELEQRYWETIEGIEVTPVLTQRAPRFVFVVGEVKTPGRFTLEGPTTVMQAIALAGSWNVGANIDQVVVFRRADDWHLMATMLDLRAALLGHRPCPADEIWVSDSDLIIVPKSKILLADNFIELVFTKGIYGVFPFSTTATIGSASTVP